MIRFMKQGLSFSAVGATRVAEAGWGAGPRGYRRYERTVRVGHGEEVWQAAATALLRWEVKTRTASRSQLSRMRISESFKDRTAR